MFALIVSFICVENEIFFFFKIHQIQQNANNIWYVNGKSFSKKKKIVFASVSQ